MPTLHMRGVYYVGHADGDLVVRAHFHARGVYSFGLHIFSPFNSPSLRAWGLLNIEWQVTGTDRSISTYVRFTSWIMSILIRITVHPHTCGVYSSMLQSRQRSAVHPHVRGVYGLLKGGLVIHHQSIPTHVGFTIPNGHAGCGKTGPSPHAWGLRGIQARRHPPLRFIPTCVGFTVE